MGAPGECKKDAALLFSTQAINGSEWSKVTLLGGGETRVPVFLRFTIAFHMDLFGLTKFTAVFTLSYRTPLLFYLEERSVGMFTG